MSTEIKMKIAVISTGRTRCTLLAKYLQTEHDDLEFCREFYNGSRDEDGNVMDPGGAGVPNQELESMDNLTEQLFAKENFIVKIISITLQKVPNLDPSVYKLEEYDQIHLVERHDFFEQCCSWEVSLSQGIFHLPSDIMPGHTERMKRFEALKKRKFRMSAARIEDSADSVNCYLKIKKYITDNNLEYTLHTYESAKQFDKKQNELVDPGLNYRELISNYHLKEEVNAVFNKYISYDNMTCDIPSFNKELGDITGFRSIESFVNNMAAKWNKKKFSMVARTGSDPASLP